MTRLPHRIVAASLLTLWLAGGGCAGDGPAAERPASERPVNEALLGGTSPAEAPAPPSGAEPEALTLAASRQATRLQRLKMLESRGTVEFRWTEEGRKRFEQCDLDLYLMLPDRSAFNLKKLGERYAWLGSSGSRWWVFRLKESPSSVEVHSWNATADTDGRDISVMSPRSILQLAGLVPIVPESTTTVREDAASKSVIIETPGDAVTGAPGARWTLDSFTSLPRVVELLDSAGVVFASGSMQDYVSAPVEGMGPGDYPKVPSRITIRRADGSGQIMLSLDSPTCRVVRMKDRYFDLDALMVEFQPDDATWREGSAAVPTPAPAAP
ncbi:MAG: hypothetical protein SGJ11_16940 [Phycisphaerae bacterium]|nr:hypothetical protein [Phycisphaerae bacterium]